MKERIRQIRTRWAEKQQGKMGYIIAWALGVPIPILLLVYLVRGCN